MSMKSLIPKLIKGVTDDYIPEPFNCIIDYFIALYPTKKTNASM